MAATLNAPPTAGPDVKALTRPQKLAALLIILGPDSAAEMLRGLDERDMAAVTAAMAELPVIDQRFQREVLREFSDVAVTASVGVAGGAEFARAAIEKALGTTGMRQFMGRFAVGGAVSPIYLLAEKEVRQLYNALKSEQPQTIALVVSFLDRRKASELIGTFPEETRARIVERLASLVPTPVSVVDTIAQRLLTRIGTHTALPFNQTGGVQPTATVLKAMDRNTSKALIEAIERNNPELGKSIRNQMFTFADVAKLDVAALQKILREVDSRALATALSNANDALKAKILSGLSKRAAEAIQEEMSFLGKVKAKEIEVAQQGIIEIVRRLEAEGQIEIPEEQPT
ncbi:MAG TPA: flagellar motor switch protein FliG [Verrucomicrobiae bacterium]|nr:flagellar motor switch protein FliG [Verrucomicrobiae bacterium]